MEIALQLGYQSFKDPSKYIEGMGTNWVQKSQTAVYAPDLIVFSINGGERGIRTLGGLAPTTVFETAPFNHSGTSPRGVHLRQPGKPGRQPTLRCLADLPGRGNSRSAEKYPEPDPIQIVQNLQRPC